MADDIQALKNKIKSTKNWNFENAIDMFLKFDRVVKKYPDAGTEFIDIFYDMVIKIPSGLLSDCIRESTSLFVAICNRLTTPEVESFCDRLISKRVTIPFDAANTLIIARPYVTNFLFNRAAHTFKHSVGYEKGHAIIAIRCILKKANLADVSDILSRFFKYNLVVRDCIMEYIGQVYIHRPELRSQIDDIVSHFTPKTPGNFSKLFTVMQQTLGVNKELAARYLNRMKQYAKLRKIDISAAYEVLGKIQNIGYDSDAVDRVFEMYLVSPINTTVTKKIAYRYMGQTDKLHSNATIGQRIKKSQNNIYGWKNHSNIPVTKPCVLFFGGNGTKKAKDASSYLRSVEELLIKHNLQDIPLYGVVYDFGEENDRNYVFDDDKARKKLMDDYHRNIRKSLRLKPTTWFQTSNPINHDTIKPKYIEQIFNIAIRPRIADKNGNKIAVKRAIQSIRNLTIVAHCHGGYTFIKLEEMMQDEMKKLGYSPDEMTMIQKQLVCVAHNPYAPLGVSKSTMVSFCSGIDDAVSHRNQFQRQARILAQKSQTDILSYFPGKLGEFFLCPEIGKIESNDYEHNLASYYPNEKELTASGKQLYRLEGNTIINSIKSAQSKEFIIDVPTLVSGGNKITLAEIKVFQQNGNKLYKQILFNAQNEGKSLPQKNL